MSIIGAVVSMSIDALLIILLLVVAALIAATAVIGIDHEKITFGGGRRIPPRRKNAGQRIRR
jgi:hypothetical protein